jgi:hypothetical protein
MGVYYKWICQSRNEHLEPVDDEPDKRPTVCHHTLQVLAWLCQHGSWEGLPVSLIDDNNDYFYQDFLEPPDLAIAIQQTSRLKATC